ncbi:MAG: tRNA (N6-isopentenyl adenosine(37)-C2)-methylthiotransferase MiaB [Lentisphaerae bacterium]|nr:tRNA (N6-isopentenyl adenosine(37)-C2)-methylthiotransferase MiaB [Lentisphaerota bacterium]
MKYHIRTYGCQMNERDSETLAALLEAEGYAPGDEAEAGLVIVNTCSVRRKAEDKALGKLGLLAARKRERPALIVGVAGCMAQRMGHEILRRVPGLDFALGTRGLRNLPRALRLVRSGRGPVLDLDMDAGRDGAAPPRLGGGVSAFVNVLYGCDRGCAYCVVPGVRGAERSRPAGEIRSEVERLAGQGTRQVVLLGQSVMSYGRRQAAWPAAHRSPRGFAEPFPRLLEAVDGVPGVARVRFTSGHPSGCTPELARAMAELPSVCEHLHLPLQSGSDRILRLMRRGYDTETYRRAARTLRAAVPGLALSTDIIVGFPTETTADFDATRRFMDEIGFDSAFVFKYSPRPGTPAADWPDDVPEEEKLRRNHALLAEQDARAQAINARLIGREVEVLAEGVSARNARRWSGRTRTNTLAVFVPPDGIAAGDMAAVRVARVTPRTLYDETTGKAEG